MGRKLGVGRQRLRCRLRIRSSTPDGGTSFSDLGLYQILEQREPGGSVDAFVHRWRKLAVPIPITKYFGFIVPRPENDAGVIA